jgi:hypothetical protein
MTPFLSNMVSLTSLCAPSLCKSVRWNHLRVPKNQSGISSAECIESTLHHKLMHVLCCIYSVLLQKTEHPTSSPIPCSCIWTEPVLSLVFSPHLSLGDWIWELNWGFLFQIAIQFVHMCFTSCLSDLPSACMEFPIKLGALAWTDDRKTTDSVPALVLYNDVDSRTAAQSLPLKRHSHELR